MKLISTLLALTSVIVLGASAYYDFTVGVVLGIIGFAVGLGGLTISEESEEN